MGEFRAIVVNGAIISVIGEGSGYLVDGHGMAASSSVENQRATVIDIYDMHVHGLNATDTFDLLTRRPAGFEQRRN